MKRIITVILAMSMIAAVEVPKDAIFVDINNGEVVAVLDLLEYDLASMAIDIDTVEALSCVKDSDRMFNDRFQQELTLFAMGDTDTVSIESAYYEPGVGVVNIVTRESIICT